MEIGAGYEAIKEMCAITIYNIKQSVVSLCTWGSLCWPGIGMQLKMSATLCPHNGIQLSIPPLLFECLTMGTSTKFQVTLSFLIIVARFRAPRKAAKWSSWNTFKRTKT